MNGNQQDGGLLGTSMRYWAFISYSSKDAKLAKRLHVALETYRISKDLVGRPARDQEGVPAKLFPVFRDRDELPLSSDLGGSIQDALRASRYLIVICTPDSARSRWVNEEIRYFKSLGREDRILALIVRGEPNARERPGQEAQECFPHALRFRVAPDGTLSDEPCEPIGGDLRPGGDGWMACLLKAIAGMTGLGYNAFAKREEKRRRRKQMVLAACAVVVCAGLVGWWDYTRVKVAYFAQLTERWGVPEGVAELDLTQVSRRQASFRIESSRRKVRRVVRVNSAGQLADDPDNWNASLQEIEYRADGDLLQINLRNHDLKLLVRRQFSASQHTTDGNVRFIELKSEFQDAPLSLGGEQKYLTKSAPTAEDSARSEISVLRVLFRPDGRLARSTLSMPTVSRVPPRTALVARHSITTNMGWR